MKRAACWRSCLSSSRRSTFRCQLERVPLPPLSVALFCFLDLNHPFFILSKGVSTGEEPWEEGRRGRRRPAAPRCGVESAPVSTSPEGFPRASIEQFARSRGGARGRTRCALRLSSRRREARSMPRGPPQQRRRNGAASNLLFVIFRDSMDGPMQVRQNFLNGDDDGALHDAPGAAPLLRGGARRALQQLRGLLTSSDRRRCLPSAAVDAIGARWGGEREFNESLACFFPLSTSTSTSSLPSLLPPHLTFAPTPTQATASAAPSPSAPPSAVTGCDTRRRSTP